MSYHELDRNPEAAKSSCGSEVEVEVKEVLDRSVSRFRGGLIKVTLAIQWPFSSNGVLR
jgi:hypothetical protein